MNSWNLQNIYPGCPVFCSQFHCDVALLVYAQVSVAAGKDGFRSEAGPWSVLATDALALEEGTYLPDFTAYIATETVRCIQISRLAFVNALLREPMRNKSFDHGSNHGNQLAVGFTGGGAEAKDRANAKVQNRFSVLTFLAHPRFVLSRNTAPSSLV